MSDSLPISEQLHLRLFQESDAEELFALIDRNRVYLEKTMSWLDTRLTVQDTRDYIKHMETQNGVTRGPAYAIVLDDHIVGAIGMPQLNTVHKVTSFGYWLSEEVQGLGIMTRVCDALIRYVFEELDMNRIEIQAGEENKKSRAIPERLGFTQEGILREREDLHGRYINQELAASINRLE